MCIISIFLHKHSLFASISTNIFFHFTVVSNIAEPPNLNNITQ